MAVILRTTHNTGTDAGTNTIELQADVGQAWVQTSDAECHEELVVIDSNRLHTKAADNVLVQMAFA